MTERLGVALYHRNRERFFELATRWNRLRHIYLQCIGRQPV
jgi:hypothetical protein